MLEARTHLELAAIKAIHNRYEQDYAAYVAMLARRGTPGRKKAGS